jgi:hypothetical protein
VPTVNRSSYPRTSPARDTITIVTDLIAWAIAWYMYQLDELNMNRVRIDSRGAQRTGSRLAGFISFLIARATACLERGIPADRPASRCRDDRAATLTPGCCFLETATPNRPGDAADPRILERPVGLSVARGASGSPA